LSQRIRAIAYLVLCHLLWSTNNIVGRSLGGHLSPYTITAMRWLIASLAYPAVMGLTPLRGARRYLGARSALLGILGFTVFNIALYQALALAPSSLVGLAYGFTPIAIIAVGVLLGSSKPTSREVAGSLLSSAGVSTLFIYRGVSIGGLEEVLGLALGVATGFIWAIYTVAQKKLYPDADQASLTYASLVTAAAVMGVAASPAIYHEARALLEPWVLAQLVWIAVFPGAVAYYMWNRAVSIVGSASAAPFSNLLPIFTALLGYVLLGEELGVGDLVGGAMIIAGSTISVTSRRETKFLR